jgi:transketolase
MQAGVRTRVVAIPSWEVFNQQEQSYQDKVIDRKTTRISLEMASTFGWAKYTGDSGLNIGIDTYGASAPGDQVIAEFGFTPDKITQRILTFLKKK